jgi:hypothetical protein
MGSASDNLDFRRWSEGVGGLAWGLSLALHCAALTAIGLATPAAPQGAVDEATREGGIVLVARSGAQADYFDDQNSHVVQTSFVASAASSLPFEPLTPPALIGPSLPTALSALPAQPIVATTGLPTAGVSTATSAGGSPTGRGHERAIETQVFGVRGKGSRFVYVFDRSSSMEGPPFAAAKRELVASLQSLQSVHQFQILFYNEEPHAMPSFRGGSPAMVFADEPGKRLATSFLGSVFAHGATDHMQALRTALRMRPDVIFLLTDANEPQLRADELRHVRQLNQGTSINAIEFGVGPPQPRYNFLRQLAAENSGQHVYVDVTRLRQ